LPDTSHWAPEMFTVDVIKDGSKDDKCSKHTNHIELKHNHKTGHESNYTNPDWNMKRWSEIGAGPFLKRKSKINKSIGGSIKHGNNSGNDVKIAY